MRSADGHRHQPAVAHLRAVDLVDIFGDHGRAGNRELVFGDQDRRGPGRIKREKAFAPLPGALLHQLQIEAVFAEHEPDEARMRTERVMEQRVHAAFDYFAALKKASTCGRGAKLPKQTGEATGVFTFYAIAAEERMGEKSPAF